MDLQLLQTVFYILGIIVLTSFLLFSIALTVVMFLLFRKIRSLRNETVEKILEVKNMSKTEIAAVIGSAAAAFVVSSLRKIFKRNKG